MNISVQKLIDKDNKEVFGLMVDGELRATDIDESWANAVASDLKEAGNE